MAFLKPGDYLTKGLPGERSDDSIMVTEESLRFVKVRGDDVVFTKDSLDNYEPVTGDGDEVIVEIPGRALRMPLSSQDTNRYRELGLVQSKSPKLLFIPTTEGELPELEMTVVWQGEILHVRDVAPLAPNGRLICAHVIVGE